MAYYNDKKQRQLNNRVSKMITEDLKVNSNPLIFAGFDESQQGQFDNFKGFKSNPVTDSYDVTELKYDERDDCHSYLVGGLEFRMRKVQ